jgi:Skp family chaperone for outer membrane proteins
MKKLLFCVLLALAPVSLASADLKIATIDMGKAFEKYYKTQEIQTHLQEKYKEAQKELQDQVADYQRISDEVSLLDKESKDPTLAPEAQKDKARARDQRGADLQAKQRAIEEFRNERTNELNDEKVRRHQEVLDAILKVVNDYSGPQGFDLVLDKTSTSVSGSPFVLFNSAKLTDITPDVIKLLNASAPATAAGGAPTDTTGTPPTH